MTKWFKMALCFGLALTLIISSLFMDGWGANVGQANTERIDQLNREIEQLEKQKQEFKRQQEQLEGEIQSIEYKIGQLNQDIVEIDQKITELEINITHKTSEIETTEEEVNETTFELQAAIERVEEREELLKTRVKAMYESGGQISYLEVLFGASSFGEFLERLDFLSLLVQQDQKIIEDFIQEKEYVEAQKLKLEGLLAQLQDQLSDLNADREQQQALEKQKRVQIAELNVEKEDLVALEAEIAAEAMRIANQVTAYEDEIQKLQWDGTFTWPVPDSHRITSYFGLRTDPINGTQRGHNGMDIGAPQGTTIIAAADGVVIVAEYLRGYGNTVIIEHGNNIRTLYGHIRNGGIKVNSGDAVKAGEKIAEVGSTGRSTGPHLHFEVHENGTQVDPLDYLRTNN